jgi:mannosyl-oligosaccharide alpha-1,3-glucosidase
MSLKKKILLFSFIHQSFSILNFSFFSFFFKNRFIDESAKFATRTWLERVVIAGLDKIPKTATLRTSDNHSTQLEIIDATKSSFIIRKPGVSMMEKWSITLNF